VAKTISHFQNNPIARNHARTQTIRQIYRWAMILVGAIEMSDKISGIGKYLAHFLGWPWM
jgi:hypothetical protein